MNGAAYLCLGTGTAAMCVGLVEPSFPYYVGGIAVLFVGLLAEEATNE